MREDIISLEPHINLHNLQAMWPKCHGGERNVLFASFMKWCWIEDTSINFALSVIKLDVEGHKLAF